MIKNFVRVCKNGFRMTPGVFPTDIPKIEFFKPEYSPTHYSWEANGNTYIRKCDSVETCYLTIAPNNKYLVVDQNFSKYGPDNLLVLNEDGSEYRRLINPYPSSAEYQEGDEYHFRDIQIIKGRLRARISVTRWLPNKGFNAEPTYSTFYDCDTWEPTPLEFVHSKAL